MSTAHSSALAHQFDSLEQQRESVTLGMWFFILQEILFFGGLFMTYMLYRWRDPTAFQAGSATLDVRMGTANTLVLIASSLTMAMAVRSAQTDRPKSLIRYLIATGTLGFVFLGIKFVEYSDKWHHHHVPGPLFHFAGPLGNRAEMFFNLYFAMTGMHALHMIVGIGLMTWILRRSLRGDFSSKYYNPLECFGLYWHFVDIIWIFLFPLLYLIGRHYHGGA